MQAVASLNRLSLPRVIWFRVRKHQDKEKGRYTKNHPDENSNQKIIHCQSPSVAQAELAAR